MGNASQLFPYRDADNRLMFRGKIGVENKVSKFFPVRVDGRLMLRGKQANGKILWGYPYRDSEGRLMGQTIRSSGCHLVVTLSGFPDGFGSGSCYSTDFRELNGTHTLTREYNGCFYHKFTANSDFPTYSGCTIAEAFPTEGPPQIGPYITFCSGGGVPGYIEIYGKRNDSRTPCSGYVSNGIYDCGELFDYIGHTWYIPFWYSSSVGFTAAVRLDAVL
jgi:hypothetical protein